MVETDSKQINKMEYIKIYPNYLDKNNKVAEGRRVNLETAVEDIQCEEIYTAAKVLNFECICEYVSKY